MKNKILACYISLCSYLIKLKIQDETNWNYSYYPVIFESETKLLKVQGLLNESGVFPRRYFYPSLNTLNYIDNISMPISESIASRIMCLPLYYELEYSEITNICLIINNSLNS